MERSFRYIEIPVPYHSIVHSNHDVTWEAIYELYQQTAKKWDADWIKVLEMRKLKLITEANNEDCGVDSEIQNYSWLKIPESVSSLASETVVYFFSWQLGKVGEISFLKVNGNPVQIWTWYMHDLENNCAKIYCICFIVSYCFYLEH